MVKEKLIIENRTKMNMYGCLSYISQVISKGKISETSKGKQYCFVTSFNDEIVLISNKNKNSDRIIITYAK